MSYRIQYATQHYAPVLFTTILIPHYQGAVQSLFAEATELIKGSNTWENAHRKDSHLARPALIGQLRGMLLKYVLM